MVPRLWLRAISNMKVKLQNAAPAPSREDLAHYREAIEEQVRDLSGTPVLGCLCLCMFWDVSVHMFPSKPSLPGQQAATSTRSAMFLSFGAGSHKRSVPFTEALWRTAWKAGAPWMLCCNGSSGRGPRSPGQTMEASRRRRARWPRRNPWPQWHCQRPKRALAEVRVPCHNEVWPGTPLALGHRNKAAGTLSEMIQQKHLKKEHGSGG